MKKSFLSYLLLALVMLGCQTKTEQKNFKVDDIKLLLPKQTTIGDTTLMKEEEFWNIIDKSRINSNNDYQLQTVALKTILENLDTIQIQRFNNTFINLLAISYDYKLWGASYVINGGCSDDCFDYFREYLIAHGKNKFYGTLKHPESCVSWVKSEEEEEWEGIRNAIAAAYEQKTKSKMPIGYQPTFSLKGIPFTDSTVEKQYPKLAKKFSNN